MAASDYLTTAEFKAEAGISDVLDDARIAIWITRAARAIDRACNVEPGYFAAQTMTKLFDWWGNAATGTAHRDLADGLAVPALLSVTTLKTDEDGDGTYEITWTAGTDYALYPLNESPKRVVRVLSETGRYTFPEGQSRIQIVGSWGYAATAPADIQEAVFLQASRYRARKNTPEGVAGNADTGFVRIAGVDPDVVAILKGGRYCEGPVFA